jgi:hypothetical protein
MLKLLLMISGNVSGGGSSTGFELIVFCKPWPFTSNIVSENCWMWNKKYWRPNGS